MEYGQWATLGSERVMIVDWTDTSVTVWRHNERETYPIDALTDISDYMETGR